jgi:hypothetical protein
MPHYGLSLLRPGHEERADLLTETELEVGDTFERLGEQWVVEEVEQSELGRFTAWLVCSPAAGEPPELA